MSEHPQNKDNPDPPPLTRAAGGDLAPSSPQQGELEDIIPGYRMLSLLGRGGMGVVYKGLQLSLDREVAIKLLPAELCGDAEFSARFEREAKSMARLNHPNIVQVYDYGRAPGGQHFFVMEFVDGQDLSRLIREGSLDANGALNAVSQVCEALQYAHSLGFVHRDIKPGNVFINRQGVLKVGDFGLAKLVAAPEAGEDSSARSSLTEAGGIMGTPHYAAPEQMGGAGPIDHRADLYSLGVMFYELLTSELPRGVPKPPSKKIARLDRRIDGVVFKAMAQEPAERYQSASELRTDIDRIRQTPAPGTGAGRNSTSTPPARRSRKAPALALAAAMTVTGLAVWFWWNRQEVPAPHNAETSPASAPAPSAPAQETAASSVPSPPAEEKPIQVPAAQPPPQEMTKPGLAAAPVEPTPPPPPVQPLPPPRENSLGMKFLPVPIPGAPAGREVWFSIWDTRIKDFETFTAATGLSVPKAEFPQEPDHPAVMMVWSEADKFCAWLTDKEHAAGLLGDKDRYRLPTDAEWSLAVGMEDEGGGTPMEKSARGPAIYPWGTAWPPPANSGNYPGEELESSKYGPDRIGMGYKDPYAHTSPGGTFPANRFGLHDMGGNVWQFTSDTKPGTSNYRIMRGGSWSSESNIRTALRADTRVSAGNGARCSHIGFRCVLEVWPGLPPKSGNMAPPKPEDNRPPLIVPAEPKSLAARFPYAGMFRSITWEGAKSQFQYRGDARIVEKDLGALKSRAPIAITFHPSGTIGFSDSDQSDGLKRALNFKSSTGNVEPIILLKHRTASEDPAVRAREAEQGVLDHVGPLVFDRAGACYFAAARGLDSIFKVIGDNPVRLEKWRQLPNTTTLQIPFFDDHHFYAGSAGRIYRLPLEKSTANKPDLSDLWFQLSVVDIYMSGFLVLSPSSLIVTLSVRRPEMPKPGEPERLDSTLLLDRKSSGFWTVPFKTYSPSSAMAMSWDGRRLIRIGKSNQLAEFSFPDLDADIRAKPDPELNWTDTKGRTIKAKFVKIAGKDVIIEVNATRRAIPLNTLSPESQKQARELNQGARQPMSPAATKNDTAGGK